MADLDEFKALIGKQGKPTVYEVDRTMIRRYCDTLGDNNPKWQDTMPPGMLACAMFMGEGISMPAWPYPGIVDAGLELEFMKPIKVGDTITIVNEFSNVEDKSSERGKRLLFSMKSIVKNQKGEVVATSTGRVMNLG